MFTMPFDTAALIFGDVILVPFPFTDQTISKQRPAVVISTAAYNNMRPDIILMAITSQFGASVGIGEVWLSGWQAAGLLKPSAIKPVIATLEQNLIVRQLGLLSVDDAQSLRMSIEIIIG